MSKQIDLRSDTVTLPTKEMMDAILTAQLGDDVKHEDRTTNDLEEFAAGLMGKEEGLLVTSGTMGNLISILTWTQNGRPEIIAETNSHLISSETGGYAYLGSVAVRSVTGKYGAIDSKTVELLIRERENVHYPTTTLICMENTHNFYGGTVVGLEDIHSIRKIADRYGLHMHLDGARVFNAAKAINVAASTICADFDSVQFCLSKGLSAPIGSIIVGSRPFIKEARYFRKMIGGGMRQSGIIAAAGIVALKNNIDRLVEDHDNAKLLATGIKNIEGIGIDMASVQTNMVRIDTSGLFITGAELVKHLNSQGVLCSAQGKYIVRFVTHRHITRNDIITAISVIEKVCESLRKRS